MCPQFSFTKNIHLGEEDCLYLSVYVPKNKHAGFNNKNAFPPSSPLPVMFWIFGGAFILGDDQEFGWYNGENLAYDEDVIVVAANYRVGAFGFLAHEEFMEEDGFGSTGNMGIQDQRMALQWVQENIAAFGGDPDKVTIFGQSAGGMSGEEGMEAKRASERTPITIPMLVTSLLTLPRSSLCLAVCTLVSNPINEGLFSRAIMESGTCNSPEFYQTLPNALDFGHTYSDIVGCPSSTPDELASYKDCMRGKKTSEIMYGIFKAWELFKRAKPDAVEQVRRGWREEKK